MQNTICPGFVNHFTTVSKVDGEYFLGRVLVSNTLHSNMKKRKKGKKCNDFWKKVA